MHKSNCTNSIDFVAHVWLLGKHFQVCFPSPQTLFQLQVGLLISMLPFHGQTKTLNLSSLNGPTCDVISSHQMNCQLH